jgi:hypothetical protein
VNGVQSWIAGVVATLLGVLVVSVLVAPRLLHLTPLAAGPYASGSLPPGVCSLSPAMLDLAHSTRVEAKLVTFDSADKNDPEFPFRQYPPPTRPASWSRITLPTPTPPPSYYWVIAEKGVYVWNVGHGFGPDTGPSTFHDVLDYVSADTCEGRGVSAGGGGWPAWFDTMPAVTDIKYK